MNVVVPLHLCDVLLIRTEQADGEHSQSITTNIYRTNQDFLNYAEENSNLMQKRIYIQ